MPARKHHLELLRIYKYVGNFHNFTVLICAFCFLQAGVLEGSMLRNMACSLTSGGPAAMYCCFVPFCLKSIPFDGAELLTYSQLRDMRADMEAEASPMRSLAKAVPEQVGVSE